MYDRHLRLIASGGLVIGAILHTIHHFRRGDDMVAAGFLVFVVGEALILAGAAMDLVASGPVFAAGAGLWAASPREGHEMQATVICESALTCPHCGRVSVEVMPTDACLYFYQCSGCQTMLRPKTGDCCVFCSYGSVKCPPVQVAGGCCAGP